MFKTRMIGLPRGEEKTYHNILSVSIEYWNATDGRTERQKCYINIARQCADAGDKRIGNRMRSIEWCTAISRNRE